MELYENKQYRIFEMFQKDWALVTAGDMKCFNSCTVGWGSMGTLWTRKNSTGSSVTVYIHPARYTYELLKDSEYFTVSFYPESCREALAYMGSHTGRTENKADGCALTPVQMGESVTYAEAGLSILCRKLYMSQLDKAGLAPEIKDYYTSSPASIR